MTFPYSIVPMRDLNEPDDPNGTQFGPCKPHEATIWAVIHNPTGEPGAAELLEDHDTPGQAALAVAIEVAASGADFSPAGRASLALMSTGNYREGSDEPADWISDLLADLHHARDFLGLDFDGLRRRAQNHYNSEVLSQGPAPQIICLGEE